MDGKFFIDSDDLEHDGWAVRLHVDAEFTGRTFHVISIESHEPEKTYRLQELSLRDRLKIIRHMKELMAEHLRDKDWTYGRFY